MQQPIYEVIKGNKDILISAPHVFPHKRPTLSCSLKQSEQYLDDIVKSICFKSGAWGIYLSNNCPEYDPNFSKAKNNPYKTKVGEIIKENKIKYFIDLHGLNECHNYDFGISFCMRYQRSKNLALELLKEFKKSRDLHSFNSKIGYIPRNTQETLTEYACIKYKIPAFQIEIAKYIRKDPVFRQLLVETFSSFVLSITT